MERCDEMQEASGDDYKPQAYLPSNTNWQCTIDTHLRRHDSVLVTENDAPSMKEAKKAKARRTLRIETMRRALEELGINESKALL